VSGALRTLWMLAWLCAAGLPAVCSWADDTVGGTPQAASPPAGAQIAPESNPAQPQAVPAQPPAPPDQAVPPPAPQPPPKASGWLSRWFNPEKAPFIPVPDIDVDPNAGTTLGIIPTWLRTDSAHDIRQIIAPDLDHNPYFGWGMHARIYNYDSTDEQWSIVSGIKERVEREFDGEYQTGRTRIDRWSFNGSVIYNVDGTPRFYGIGNESPEIAETDYTAQEELIQAQLGYNFDHMWQLQYTGRFENVDVLPGTLARIASITTRFGRALGEGDNREFLNRLSIVLDTRDDIIIPTTGSEWVAYGGAASRNGLFNASLYTEAGVDGREFWPVGSRTIIAFHTALRYLPNAHRVPFWALSSIGGADTVIGGEQPLRGFGEGRFYDRDSFSSSLELRRKMATFDAISTTVDLEVTPFVDVGRVFEKSSTVPLEQLHKVYGMGFRGIAKPFVVGYVDIGYGSEGAAVFTGINYPF